MELSRDACKISLDTLSRVSKCPTNQEEYESEAKRKNCFQYNNAKCPPLLYHCVWNDNTTYLVEVCAASRFILGGKCALFNTGYLIIRDNYVRNCSYLAPPCSQFYTSTESYKYSGCYTLDENSKPVTVGSDIAKKEVFPTWAIVLSIIGCIALVATVACTIHRCRCKRNQNRANPTNSEDEVTDAEMKIPCDPREIQGHQCCPGSFFNRTAQECQFCSAGYTGLNCSERCPPGLYGVECQTECPLECSFNCDHSTGKCSDHIEKPLISMLGDEHISNDINPNSTPFGSLSKDPANSENNIVDTSTGNSLVRQNDGCPPGMYGLECQSQCPMECSRDCDHTTGNGFIHKERENKNRETRSPVLPWIDL
ncbi:cell death abnormality protein 1-like isoform X2 [Ostrea edulis]|uniref:cell death abnormality protein 1-like isoform X2 n=1 Tax=Ostrea edulis TaxID=37623 RepID=UPI0024AF7296|nr:cell death abnormality protein 1-like isoform X2 [Ostrea edulis]